MHDRDVGAGRLRSGAPRDAAQVEANRRIGEILLRADEIEETLDSLRREPSARPLHPGADRAETLRGLERRALVERARVEALERIGSLDYDGIERAMRIADAAG